MRGTSYTFEVLDWYCHDQMVVV